MIVRTYGRRNRSSNSDSGMSRSYSGSASDNDAVLDPFGFGDSLTLPSSQEESPSQEIYNSFAFSSQDSSHHWPFDSEPYLANSSQVSRQLPVLPPWEKDGDLRRSKKGRRNGKIEVAAVGPKKMKSVGHTATVVNTATLMETQEFGEMMEHVDEVNFALDGLRLGQPVRVQRASLLSLLSICGTAQKRRLLRTHGTAKTIVDAVLKLSLDDSPTNLAAAALFYILTCDDHDDHLLESPNCIRFLIKLLKPLISNATRDKAPGIGNKLLALRMDSAILKDSRGVDSTSDAIALKVQEILVSCKEMKLRDGKHAGGEKPELSPKWISLLTMEKACLSTISLEETSGMMRKTGDKFKEKLREYGGLDVVFEVARNCHSTMEKWLQERSSNLESKDNVNLECLAVLVKCLKIMENATFLSQDNQSHLLGMKGNFNSQCPSQSFTQLILSVIKILSGVSLLINLSWCSDGEKLDNFPGGKPAPGISDGKVDNNGIFSINSFSMESTSSQRSITVTQSQSSHESGFSKSNSEITNTPVADTRLLKSRASSSAPSSCGGTSRSSSNGTCVSNYGSWINIGFGKRSEVTKTFKFKSLEDSQDPFAFDEGEVKPSKWDLLSERPKVSQTQRSRAAVRECEDGCQSQLMFSQEESSNVGNNNSLDVSFSSVVEEEKSHLLADCLLTAVKVLMNLTNDNPVGCQQIAACGGLETLSSLIASHFPPFSSYLPPFSELRENSLSSKSPVEVDHQANRHLTDQELDFLVAILGLLVNLVEKDGRNRSRLAATSVSLPSLRGLEDVNTDVISLLCSIFLANQGAGEAAEEGKQLAWDAEEALLQGEKEAEKMIVEAYSALLLAFLSTESKSIRSAIGECLPDHNLAILVPVLERFVEFHLTLNMISPETHTTVLEVIESCRYHESSS